MEPVEIVTVVLSLVVVPWLIFVTKAILKISTKQDAMHMDVKWIRPEHEPEGGVQAWKNPGLVEAIDKLSEQVDRFRDGVERALREGANR